MKTICNLESNVNPPVFGMWEETGITKNKLEQTQKEHAERDCYQTLTLLAVR